MTCLIIIDSASERGALESNSVSIPRSEERESNRTGGVLLVGRRRTRRRTRNGSKQQVKRRDGSIH